MAGIGFREVALWRANVAWERRADGSILVRQTGALPDYPDRLSDRIVHWAAVAPGRVWMAERGSDGEWRRVSYAELLSSIRSIGQRLLELGLGPERPLAILSGNSLAHALMALGAQYAGIPSAAVSTGYSLAGEGFGRLKEVAAQTTPGAVFADDTDRYAAALRAVFPDLPHLGLRGAGRRLEWRDLISAAGTAQADAAYRATGPDTVAKFMFTSGTTGTPKAVIQTQRMLCSNMAMVLDCYAYLKDEPPVFVDWAPWSHVAAGNKVFNMAIYNGGTYYIDEGKPTRADIGKSIRNLAEISPNWYFNVPAGYEMLVEAMRADPAMGRNFFRDLKLLMYAGAAMGEHLWNEIDRQAEAATGTRVLQTTGLGSTETAPFALFCTDPQDRPGNVGIPAKGITLKLVPQDGQWEARLKGPNVTPGYWRDAAQTAAAFDEEGFYKLGDALRFADAADPAKGFFFDGRTAENFKMSTGTWVAVGNLRKRIVDALNGMASDAVIAGEGREALGVLLVPFRPAIERIVPNGAALADSELFAHPEIRAAVATALAAYNAKAGGASERVARARFFASAPDRAKGELTEKGSVNQRAALRLRDAEVAAMFAGDAATIDIGR